eukprot:TRINITY_DN3885_c0_g1_i4.p1 TRINITY_DN3885_c0_g1~~TRINITY_DN3885_c0_g1_i4.p1  ORF type:complete len:147 (+),score=21.62 TRINITY_DN3885_c0_g1_i4:42-482(+)
MHFKLKSDDFVPTGKPPGTKKIFGASPCKPCPVLVPVAAACFSDNCSRRLELIAIAFFLPLSLSCLNADLFVVLLQCSQVFSCFTEFTLLHAFTHVVVHKGTFGVHQVELVVNARKNSAIAVLFEIMQQARITLARSPPGTTVGGW